MKKMVDKSLKKKAIKIKGSDYVLVKDRILYFNETYPGGSIETEYKYDKENGLFMVKASVYPDVQNEPDRFYTGLSQASYEDGGASATAPLENAETSAVGRALAMMGIGVLDSFASADEMRRAGVDGKPKKASEKQMSYLNSLIAGTGELPDNFYKNRKLDPEKIDFVQASRLIEELKDAPKKVKSDLNF